MPRFLAADLPPGLHGDVITQVLEAYEVRYRISEDVDELTEFLKSAKKSAEIRLEPDGSTATLVSETTEGEQRLNSERDSGFQLKSIGNEPFNTQVTSSSPQNESVLGGSLLNPQISVVQQPPRSLTALDILLEASFKKSKIVDASGIQRMDFRVKEEEPEEVENLLLTQNPPPPQPILPPFFDVRTLVKEEIDDNGRQDSGVIERLVKEEPIYDDYGDSGARHDEDGEKAAVETLQDAIAPFDNHSLFNSHPPRGFQCPVCSAVFFTSVAFGLHFSTHPACEHCCHRFSNVEILKAHIYLNHKGDAVPLGRHPFEDSPPTVREVLKKKVENELLQEKKKRGAVDEFLARKPAKRRKPSEFAQKMSLECEVCRGSYLRESCLRRHLFATHSIVGEQQRPFKCRECVQWFADEDDCFEHHSGVHGGEEEI